MQNTLFLIALAAFGLGYAVLTLVPYPEAPARSGNVISVITGIAAGVMGVMALLQLA